jgi:glutathione S-transferase
MLKLWGRSTSSNVQKVRWLCGEMGVAYEQTEVGGAFGRTREPFYLAMNPMALVPTLDDDGFTLFESNSILRYVASKHGAIDWYPGALRERADCERWLDWSLSALAPAITPSFWGLIRTAAEQRDRKAILASAQHTAQMFEIIDARLRDRAFLGGNRPTLADIPAGIQAHRWLNLPFELVGYQRPELPGVRAWYDRLAQRRAFQDTVMIPMV